MEPVKINIDELGLYVLACEAVASHVGVFRGPPSYFVLHELPIKSLHGSLAAKRCEWKIEVAKMSLKK